MLKHPVAIVIGNGLVGMMRRVKPSSRMRRRIIFVPAAEALFTSPSAEAVICSINALLRTWGFSNPSVTSPASLVIVSLIVLVLLPNYTPAGFHRVTRFRTNMLPDTSGHASD